jgi:sortase A
MDKRNIVITAVTIGAAVFCTTLVRAVAYAPEEPHAPPAPPPSYAQDAALPSRLVIPTLGVDARVEHVGVSAQGNMSVPQSYLNAGWYRYGTVPGERGSAVINGHLDNGLALPAVFSRLSELLPGDELYIETEEGERLRFVVEETARYPSDEVPLETVFNRSDGASRLNLITCAGSWDEKEDTYDERLVAYARYAP